MQYINRCTAQFRSPQHDSLMVLTSQANTAPKLSRILPQIQLSVLYFFRASSLGVSLLCNFKVWLEFEIALNKNLKNI